MSSMVIWRDDATGVVAEWHKGESYSIRVEIDDPLEGRIRGQYSTDNAAIGAAYRLAERLKKDGPVLISDERSEVDELMRGTHFYADNTGSGHEAWRLDLEDGHYFLIKNLDGSTGGRIDEEYDWDYFTVDDEFVAEHSGRAESLNKAIDHVTMKMIGLGLKPLSRPHPRNARHFTAGELSMFFMAWTMDQGLPPMSADELLHEEITPAQRRWLSAFVLLWEAQQAIDDGRKS